MSKQKYNQQTVSEHKQFGSINTIGQGILFRKRIPLNYSAKGKKNIVANKSRSAVENRYLKSTILSTYIAESVHCELRLDKKIKDLHHGPNDVLKSFYVASLFTGAPVARRAISSSRNFDIYISLPYSNKSKRCQLCNLEKTIISRPELGTLNKRNELASSCRHRAPFLFRNFKP